MPHRFENIDFRRTFSSIPNDIVALLQEKENERNWNDFNSLKEQLQKGKCSLCGKPLDCCDVENPCFHFLLNPKLKKKEREALFSKPQSFIKLYTYLTWVANSEYPFVNINDIVSDISPNRLYESTIRYKNINWSFCFRTSDLEGHKGTKSEQPHYHFYMAVDGKPVITFNNTHISFTPDDFLIFEIIKQKAAVIDPQFSSGLETLKNGVYVVEGEDGSIIFIEVISEHTIYYTFVQPCTITITQIEEIGDAFEKSNNKYIYQIIEDLNKEKGYRINSVTYSALRENPVIKIRRD